MSFDLENNLTSKLGPLPGYAWVGIGVGAVYLYRKRHPSTIKTTSLNPAAPIETSSTPASSGPAPAPTNEDWAKQAAHSLYGSSAYSPDDISAAISAFLSGATPTTAQQGVINAATLGLGNPPAPLGPQVDYLPYYGQAPTPDITPGYTNPPGFSPALNEGSLGTSLNQAPIYTVDPAGTAYTGGTPIASGAIAGALDPYGSSVFIPAPNAPQISASYVPVYTPSYSPTNTQNTLHDSYSTPSATVAPASAPAPTNIGAGSGNLRVQ